MSVMGLSRGAKFGIAVGAFALLGPLVFGGCSTRLYTYECLICHQGWSRKTTELLSIPVMQRGTHHTANDHPPTYRGGGYSRETWSILGTVIGCGRHSQQSGDLSKFPVEATPAAAN